jgi:isopentenyl-diphosphate delta-isomerase type 1
LDHRGLPRGATAKQHVHDAATPLHLAFSCYLVAPDGRILLTRRALDKKTWPGVWTNSCCGHPQLGESLRQAVTRRAAEELGVVVTSVRMLLADFAYRAEMDDGTVEHELCPVLVGEVDGHLSVDPAEVADHEWASWDELVDRARTAPGSLSPWCVEQITHLEEQGGLLAVAGSTGHSPVLDAPIATAPSSPLRSVSTCDPLAPVLGPLRGVLDAHIERKVVELSAIDQRLGDVTAEIGGLLAAGGKRLRPAFVWWGHRATGAEPEPEVLHAAAAVEVLHTFALLHDDVMDRSARRRGRPSAHVAFTELHAEHGMGGDAAWFGVGAAILAGDLAYVWADELFEATDLPSEAIARARSVFTTLRSEVIAGQYLDLRLGGEHDAGEQWARQVALLKSARYTVTRPLLLGAALAPTVRPEVEAALAAFGDSVGIAFQMRDDVLGLFGDPASTGKSCLDDLREGKRTVLVLRALRLADAAGRALLTSSLGDPELSVERAHDCCAIVAESGALASVEARIRADHARAEEALAAIEGPANDALSELARSAIERTW